MNCTAWSEQEQTDGGEHQRIFADTALPEFTQRERERRFHADRYELEIKSNFLTDFYSLHHFWVSCKEKREVSSGFLIPLRKARDYGQVNQPRYFPTRYRAFSVRISKSSSTTDMDARVFSARSLVERISKVCPGLMTADFPSSSMA